MPRWIAVLLTIFTAAAVAADTPEAAQPVSPQAKSAMKIAANKITNTEQTYRASKKRALEDEIEALNSAKATAMRNNDLDEANAIAAKVKDLRAVLENLTEDGEIGPKMWKVFHQSGANEIVWLFANGRGVSSRSVRMAWLPTGNELLFLYANGGTKTLTLQSDGRTYLSGPDTFAPIDPTIAPMPPRPND
jgi:hypothetical protein